MKTRGSHRVYRRRDVELAVMIRKLLHDDGYTVPGARKRLQELIKDRQDGTVEPTRQSAAAETNLRADLLAIREQLQHLLNHLDAAEAKHLKTSSAGGQASATPSQVPARNLAGHRTTHGSQA